MIFTKIIRADYPWADLQCTKAVHGDEPEALRRVHAAVQGGTGEFRCKMEVVPRSHEMIASSHSLGFFVLFIKCFIIHKSSGKL